MTTETPPFIPQAAPGLRFRSFRNDIDRALRDCLDSGLFILGPQMRSFEHELADFLGAGHAVACNSGTDALFLALKALGIGRGDEVITVSLTAAGTAVAITRTGAKPCFVDVSESHRCMDAALLESAITPRVKAVVAVHLHGNPTPIDTIMAVAERHSLVVVEDCAQAIGAKIGNKHVGTFGHAAAFSFFPTKNLGCMGDGGAVVTNDPHLAAEVASMRNYGWSADRLCEREGTNSRLDEIQAAVLRVLLPHVPESNAARQEAARRYDQALAGLPVRILMNLPDSVYHQYVIEVDCRDELRGWLAKRNIGTAVHYRTGLHAQPFYRDRDPDLEESRLPITETLCSTMLSLPIQPELMSQQVRIIDTVEEGLSRCRASCSSV